MSNVLRDEFMVCPICGTLRTTTVATPTTGVAVCAKCGVEYRYSQTLRMVFDTEVF
jgi:transcription elongation factor Elf1